MNAPTPRGHVVTGRSGPNRSTAVMQRRRHTPPDALDYFPTPPWATRALCAFLLNEGHDLSTMAAWEPACGEMHMVKPLREHFASVRASDVHRYCDDHELIDFALTGWTEPEVDFVVSNPPFKLAEEFIHTGLKVARVGVAMLVRLAFIEGQDRHETLYSVCPPTFALQFVERVAMLEGRLVRAGTVDPFAEEEGTKVSSATAYCWVIWLKGHEGDCRLRWIAPCRLKLERVGDYPDYPLETLPPPEDGLFGPGVFG
jgi:hypothetical protein